MLVNLRVVLKCIMLNTFSILLAKIILLTSVKKREKAYSLYVNIESK